MTTGSTLSDRAKLIHNEQTKLTATMLNGVALAFVVGGGVTTITGLGSLSTPETQLLRVVVWISTGAILHVVGRVFLRNLL